MLFNSLEFICIFLPLTVILYFRLNRLRMTEAAKGLLVFASLVFYSWWKPIYLPLILASILFNYVVGVSLTRPEHCPPRFRQPLLMAGIACNIALLGFYKYADFAIRNINFATGADLPLLGLALPLAISFFTFQQITYLVDSYTGKAVETDFLNYTVFVTFFPQLIAGPIVHHSEMMPQFRAMRNKVPDYRNISRGLFVFSLGLFKKAAIADTLARFATAGFDTPAALSMADAWCASLSYTLQIYFDFSGYTDMAIGSALLMNIKLPVNFDSPYKSLDIQEFWRRWHITLSRFLRDYLYIPLGGNRRGGLATYRNLFVTFLLGGLWHGAGWTFVLWGALHGAAVVAHRAWKRAGMRMPKPLAWFITFNFVNLTWVFFRARTWDDALRVLHGMFLGQGGRIILTSEAAWALVIFGAVALITRNSIQRAGEFRPNLPALAAGSAMLIYCLVNLNRFSEFLYFNF